jgi:hypothetical protein
MFGMLRFKQAAQIVCKKDDAPVAVLRRAGSSRTSPALKSTWRHCRVKISEGIRQPVM